MIIYEIKKSTFITQKFTVKTKQDVKTNLLYIRQKFKDASHVCYAYITEKGASGGKSDDGEPKNSVGLPLLKLLQIKKQENLLIVVIRYYGKIKIGKSKLTVAYLKGASQILNDFT